MAKNKADINQFGKLSTKPRGWVGKITGKSEAYKATKAAIKAQNSLGKHIASQVAQGAIGVAANLTASGINHDITNAKIYQSKAALEQLNAALNLRSDTEGSTQDGSTTEIESGSPINRA